MPALLPCRLAPSSKFSQRTPHRSIPGAVYLRVPRLRRLDPFPEPSNRLAACYVGESLAPRTIQIPIFHVVSPLIARRTPRLPLSVCPLQSRHAQRLPLPAIHTCSVLVLHAQHKVMGNVGGKN